METWREVIDWPQYSVSSEGRIRNNRKQKLLNPSLDSKGYKKISVGAAKDRKTLWIHREIAKCFLENPTNLPIIDHINRNRQDNRIENLRWVTYSDNQVNRDYINNSTGERCIYKHGHRFVVMIRRKGYPRIQQYFSTLGEAKIFRDSIIV
jgi:hypothetical protein